MTMRSEWNRGSKEAVVRICAWLWCGCAAWATVISTFCYTNVETRRCRELVNYPMAYTNGAFVCRVVPQGTPPVDDQYIAVSWRIFTNVGSGTWLTNITSCTVLYTCQNMADPNDQLLTNVSFVLSNSYRYKAGEESCKVEGSGTGNGGGGQGIRARRWLIQ